METSFEKFRAEREMYEIEFTKRLGASETLTGTPTVTVKRALLTSWLDVTADILVAGSPTIIDGKFVGFVLKPAVDEAQPAGLYLIEAVATTTDTDVIVGRADLTVKA